MAYLTPQELKTHLYQEQLDAIVREDEMLILLAIDTAIAEAKSYLAAYDRNRIFSADGQEDRNPLLYTLVKDMAIWHLIVICNAGVQMEYREGRYNRAIQWLKDVQRGNASPDLPRVDTNADGKEDAPAVYKYGSNPKRTQHF